MDKFITYIITVDSFDDDNNLYFETHNKIEAFAYYDAITLNEDEDIYKSIDMVNEHYVQAKTYEMKFELA